MASFSSFVVAENARKSLSSVDFLRKVPSSRLLVVVCESEVNVRLPLVDRLG